MTFLERRTRVGRLRIRAAADDPVAVGMRTEGALRPLDLVPPGMPPQAILCIRSMADPLPGGIDVRSAHAPRPTAWERSARGAVGEALRRAVHVAFANAAAADDAADAVVIFADRAELLAAAARDAVHARLMRWYWRDVLRAPAVDAVVEEWKREPMYVPAALELLAAGSAHGDAVAFARLIPPSDALELSARVLPALAALLAATSAVAAVPSAPLSQPARAPWTEVVPEAADATTLAPEQRLLVGVALAVRRASALVRRESFASECAAWLAAAAAEVPARTTTAAGEVEAVAASIIPPPPTPAVSQRHVAADIAHAPLRSVAAMPPLSEPRHGRRTPHHEPRALDTTAAPPLRLAPPTPTEFAGLFFFLNLDLYDEDSELDRWEFLALLGRALDPEMEADPLWNVLAELADRPLDRDPGTLEWPDPAPLLRERLPVDDPIAFLLRRFGRVALTPAHVDVFFSLAAHPIEIRLSGLDRDPGWLLPAGRHVAFHFD